MIVVTANWAFADGTLVAADRSRVGAWFTAVRRAALRAGWRRDGSYRPIDGVDVVLAGDTFDWLASAAWAGSIRPWHGGSRAADVRRRVMETSARRAAGLLRTLGRGVQRGLAVPCGDRRGRPRLDATTTVPVRVTLLVGDRDAWLDDAAPWLAARGGAVARSWATATVAVAHGADVDPLCFDPETAAGSSSRDRGRAPTAAESLVIDLLVRFALALRDHSDGERLARGAATRLAAIPPLHWPGALANWLAGLAPDSMRDRAADAWLRSVAAWRRSVDRDPPAWDAPACPWDELAARLETGAHASIPEGGGPAEPVLAPASPRRATVCRVAEASVDVVVLGHPPAFAPPLEAVGGRDPRDPRVVCLGAHPVRPWEVVGVVESGSAMPVACVGATPGAGLPGSVVLRGDPDSPTVEWLQGRPDQAWATRPDTVVGSVIDAA